MVNDLQLISSMCSACGNASYVATAGKTGLDGGLVCVSGGVGGVSLCSTLMGRNPRLRFQFRRGRFLLCCRGSLRNSSHLALTVWRGAI